MSGVTANPPTGDSKTAVKRKKNKDSVANATIMVPKTDGAAAATGSDAAAATVNGGDNESAFVKELQKNVRNLKKKLANTEKAQSIVTENSGKSLDELLAERKLNADQKKQLENKPGVEAQLKQTEEQLVQYRKFEEDCEQRATRRAEEQQAELQKEHESALKAKDVEFDKTRGELEAEFRSRLLTLSQFLRTAAARRLEEKQPENDAFEGVLLQLYGGDLTAVAAMEKLINGDESIVPTVEGEPSGFSFQQIRLVVKEQGLIPETTEQVANTGNTIESDPTVVHAGLTEIEQSTTTAAGSNPVKIVPEASIVDAGAANAAAAAATTSADLAASGTSDAWVEIRNPNETDTGLNATPAAITNQESWAEDVPTESVIVQPTGDGFTDVKHNRGGRGRGRGGRSRGEYRGDYRGRGRGGFRGDGERGRGRGRGGYRGGRGGAPQGGQAPAAVHP